MKKCFRSLLILLLSFSLAALFNSIDINSQEGLTLKEKTVQAAETKVTTDALNLRTGPGTGYSIILTMPKGSQVTVLSTSNGWSKVTYKGTTGYAYAKYLASPDGTTYLSLSSVNLRSGPGTGYSILTKIPGGSFVTVYSISNNWARVSYNGKTGYSYASYLSRGTSYVTTSSLNLRRGPSTGYSIILTMPAGASVRVYKITSNWAWLSYKGYLGYSSMSYLKLPGSGTTSPEAPASGTCQKIYKGVTSYSGNRIAITFDDGADSTNVNAVLDILDDYNAKSTFFFTGEWVQAYPETSRKIIARGHRMESHTVSHPYLTDLSDTQVLYQLNRSREIIKSVTGTTATLIRPPYGDYSSRIISLAGQAGYEYMVLWSMDTDDYMSTTSEDEIVSRAVAGATNNAILLLHPSHDKVVDALPRILSQLKAKGYSFVTVNSMLP